MSIIRTTGDRVQDKSFSEMPGTGFFTAELERALQEQQVDIAVHSHKDLPTQSPEGLIIGAVSARAEAADWLLMQTSAEDRSQLLSLIKGAKVGTASARRRTQLLAIRPDLTVETLRGNVPTRVEALRKGNFDAVVLAGAGLERLALDLSDLVVLRLDPFDFPGAPAQGVLAFQARKSDQEVLSALASVHHEPTALTIRAERQILANLRGGCQLPFGAYAQERDGITYLMLCLGDERDRFPLRLFLEHPDPDVLVVEAWSKIHAKPPSSVYISRDLQENSILLRACADHKIALHAQSLLQFEDLAATWPAHADWVVFSSRTAVQVFGRHSPPIAPGVRFAAVGEGTARELHALGHHPAQTLSLNDEGESLEQFSQLVRGCRVLFPGAENSLRSIQESMSSQTEVLDLPIYRNTPKAGALHIPEVELAILSSPMNATEYLRRFPDRAKGRFVAIGGSTARALRKGGARQIFEARQPSELALVEAIFSA